MHGSSWLIAVTHSTYKISNCEFTVKPKKLSLFFGFPWNCVHRSINSVQRKSLGVNVEVKKRNITGNQVGWGIWPLLSLFKVAWLSFVWDNSFLHDIFPYTTLLEETVSMLEVKIEITDWIDVIFLCRYKLCFLRHLISLSYDHRKIGESHFCVLYVIFSPQILSLFSKISKLGNYKVVWSSFLCNKIIDN